MWQAEQMQVVCPKERPIVEALALSDALLSRAEAEGTMALAVSVVHGPAVILGAMQRTGRVVDLEACARAGVQVLRRATTGTAAWIGDSGGLILALALPHVAAIHEDATPRTLLNRNVRPFLRAFTHAGVMAHYFGREWISLRKRPAALLGFDMRTHESAVLIEVIVGLDQSIALPVDLMTADERAVDRFMGKTPASLREVLPDARPSRFADQLIQGFVDSLALPTVEQTSIAPGDSRWTTFTNEMAPWVEGFRPHSLVRVPIGYLDVGVCSSPGSPRFVLGGDVLAPRRLYEEISRNTYTLSKPPPAQPIEGATLEDMLRAVDGLTP